MIHLFKDRDNDTDLSIEAIQGGARVVISEHFNSESNLVEHLLTRKDIYHLIGSLHLIQKELKEVENG